MHEHRRCDTDSPDRERRAVGMNRRTVLSSVSAGAIGVVAGCLSRDGESDEVDTSEGWVTAFSGRIDDFDPVNPTNAVEQFAFDVGFISDSTATDPTFVLASDIDETAERISITLKPDLEWSNGDPLTAADLGRWVYMYRMGSGRLAPVGDVRDGTTHPRTGWEAITDVTWTERTLTVEGLFGEGPSPLFELNTTIGSRPQAHYDPLWEAFQDVFDEFSDGEPRDTVTSLVDDNIWHLSDEFRPESGISLENNGSGQEAAFSGLWYPSRIEDGYLHFSINDAHPFADRVSFDTVYWKYLGERALRASELQSGSVDGMRLDEVTKSLLESVPDHVDSFDGAPRGIVTMTVNHRAPYLSDRDVRAALMYAISRDALVENVDLVSRQPVTVPGGDLQSTAWLPDELRQDMRSYEYDPDRATSVLERAGFEYTNEWKTPSGETFEIELLSDDRAPTLHQGIESQLSSFGIDVTSTVLEGTSYQTHLDDGTFFATDNRLKPLNAAERRRTRAGDYVRSIIDEGLHFSSFLGSEIEAAIDQQKGLSWTERGTARAGEVETERLTFESIDALRSITVEAPPLGEPDGPIREWPYLYHAVLAEYAHEIDEKIEHARRCTWIYNYVLPELELMIEVPQVFHDTDRWHLPPSDDPVWNRPETGNHPGDLWAALGRGRIDISKADSEDQS